MSSNVFFTPALEAQPELRSAFLLRVGAWTLGGLLITAISSVICLLFVVPMVFKLGTIGVLVAVYGSMFFSQTVGRSMVFGQTKVLGFLLGTSSQGLAFSFLLAVTLFGLGNVSDGLLLIGQCLLMVLLTSGAMFAYVSMARREFSLLGAGLSMMFIPMLVLMGISLIWPIGGTLGIVVSGLFVVVSAGSLLYKLNQVVHRFDASMSLEAGYELSLSLVVLLWNLIVLFSRLRRR